ncbi:MAG: response regulator [Sandaracinus sp.]
MGLIAQGPRKRILVVEDDDTSARMVRDYLEAHGYDISVAANGNEGLERFRSEHPDLMIVDVALPKKSGFDLCIDVKQTEHGRTMPVLLMSAVFRGGETTGTYPRDGMGPEAMLAKPFDLSVLLRRVQQLLGRAA